MPLESKWDDATRQKANAKRQQPQRHKDTKMQQRKDEKTHNIQNDTKDEDKKTQRQKGTKTKHEDTKTCRVEGEGRGGRERVRREDGKRWLARVRVRLSRLQET
jgi:hypothetical protein